MDPDRTKGEMGEIRSVGTTRKEVDVEEDQGEVEDRGAKERGVLVMGGEVAEEAEVDTVESTNFL